MENKTTWKQYQDWRAMMERVYGRMIYALPVKLEVRGE